MEDTGVCCFGKYVWLFPGKFWQRLFEIGQGVLAWQSRRLGFGNHGDLGNQLGKYTAARQGAREGGCS
jgi:hypothetical protein